MAACRGQVETGNYAVASIVRSSVASDGADSSWRRAASTAACAVVAEADFEFYAIAFEALAGRSSVDAEETATQIPCPVGKERSSS